MSPVIRKRKKKFTISSKYLLLILCGICVALMVFTFRTSLFEGPFKTVAGYVVVPFQKGIAEVGGYFSDRSRELEQLREELEERSAQMQAHLRKHAFFGPGRLLKAFPKMHHGAKGRSLDALREALRRRK